MNRPIRHAAESFDDGRRKPCTDKWTKFLLWIRTRLIHTAISSTTSLFVNGKFLAFHILLICVCAMQCVCSLLLMFRIGATQSIVKVSTLNYGLEYSAPSLWCLWRTLCCVLDIHNLQNHFDWLISFHRDNVNKILDELVIVPVRFVRN